ncbi:hypothetical protein RUMOBE_01564 [Blautia obeum ATCC 29174]|jgi:hypothetical protein|uniref:Uncharacterized protein n=1 Tax=Blautia obeum ATCC 29174 TaxID=411459 RepID=A5ZRD7_9FIRM|nr:hypothetical protein RUMOBE_01564 [Blautia obeum ATCC 29174]
MKGQNLLKKTNNLTKTVILILNLFFSENHIPEKEK